MAGTDEGLQTYTRFPLGCVPIDKPLLVYGGELMRRRTGSLNMGPRDEQDGSMMRCASKCNRGVLELSILLERRRFIDPDIGFV